MKRGFDTWCVSTVLVACVLSLSSCQSSTRTPVPRYTTVTGVFNSASPGSATISPEVDDPFVLEEMIIPHLLEMGINVKDPNVNPTAPEILVKFNYNTDWRIRVRPFSVRRLRYAESLSIKFIDVKTGNVALLSIYPSPIYLHQMATVLKRLFVDIQLALESHTQTLQDRETAPSDRDPSP